MTRSQSNLTIFKRSSLLVIYLALILASKSAWSQDALGSLAKTNLEQTFATTIVLTDAEVITFGFVNFDPNSILPVDTDDGFGSEESLERRSSLQTYSFPLRWQLTQEEDTWQSELKLRLGYLEINQDILLEDFEPGNRDELKDQVFDVAVQNSWQRPISNHWDINLGAALHLMHYRNKYRYNDPFLENIRQEIDNLLLNTDATALVAEPHLGFVYSNDEGSMPWRFRTALNYSYGRTVDTDDDRQKGNPEALRWTNGVVLHWHMPPLANTPNQLRFLARRVDIDGDVVETLGTHHFYELGVGWLFDTHKKLSWFDNLGLGVSLNIGSALSGGSLVLLYNEDY